MRCSSTFFVLSTFALLSSTGFAAPARLTVTHLETQAIPEALGIADPVPRLSWALIMRGARRAAEGFSCPRRFAARLAREGRRTSGSSREVTSPDPWVLYTGPALASRTRYYWAVRVSAGVGLESDWTKPTWFETAFLEEARVERPVDRRPRTATGADLGRG